MLLFPLQILQVKYSRIVAEMNGFCSSDIVTVDKHTCSSLVVIKLGGICVAVDVVVDRFNLNIPLLECPQQSKGLGYKLSSYSRKQEFQGNKNLNLHFSTLYIHNM